MASHLSDQLPQAPPTPRDEVAPDVQQACGPADRGVQGACVGEIVDGQYIELTGADSLDAVGRAFAALAKRRLHGADQQGAMTGGDHGR